MEEGREMAADFSLAAVLLMGLAAFRLTRLIVFDKITEFIRAPFFNEIEQENEQGEKEIYLVPKSDGLRGWIGELLSCYWCTGIWVSLFIGGLHYFGTQTGEFLIVILAVAAIASFIETVTLRLLGQ